MRILNSFALSLFLILSLLQPTSTYSNDQDISSQIPSILTKTAIVFTSAIMLDRLLCVAKNTDLDSLSTQLNNILNQEYFHRIAACGLIALGGGYLWHRFQSIPIDIPNYDSDEPRYEIPGIVGACPPEVYRIIKQFKEDNKKINIGFIRNTNFIFDNVLLFEGPTGIGKTTLARAIAKNTGSHLVEIYGADILNSFIGGSKDIINQRIEYAIAEGAACKQRVIIFIDEIDAFSCNENSLARTEYDAAYKALWRHIDDNKDNLGVFFIFATNHLNRLPVELRNRIDAGIVHMKNPDAMQRKELLDHFSKEYTQLKLSEYCSQDCIEKLIRETKDFSIRNISTVCKYTHYDALRKGEQPSSTHLMKALEKVKHEVELQHLPNKEEQYRLEAQLLTRLNTGFAAASFCMHVLDTYIRKYGFPL